MQRFYPTLFLCIALSFLSACGGREPTTVIIHQLGDDDKTCEELAYELDNIEKKVAVLLPEANTLVRNLSALRAAIVVNPAALMFMDLSQAQKHEINALNKRYDYLLTLAKRKDCLAEDTNLPPLPAPPPKKR